MPSAPELARIRFSDPDGGTAEVPEGERASIAADAYRTLNATYDAALGARSSTAHNAYSQRDEYLAPDEIRVIQLEDPTDGDLGTYMAVPSYAIVEADGTSHLPDTPHGEFAGSIGGTWGSEVDTYAATQMDYGESTADWARIRTTWTWWKLSENNSSYDYALLKVDAAMENAGGNNRTKWAQIGTKSNNTSALKLEQDPVNPDTSGCDTIPITLGVSGMGVGADATWSFRKCEQMTPAGTSLDIDQGFFTLTYNHPNDGAQDARSLSKGLTMRIPASTYPQWVFAHGVTHNYYCPDCKSCAS